MSPCATANSLGGLSNKCEKVPLSKEEIGKCGLKFFFMLDSAGGAEAPKAHIPPPPPRVPPLFITSLWPDYDFWFIRCRIYRPQKNSRKSSWLAGILLLLTGFTLGLLIVLYGLEGLHPRACIYMYPIDGLCFREICTSIIWGWGKISSEQVPKVVLVSQRKKMHLIWLGGKIVHLRIIKSWFSSRHVISMKGPLNVTVQASLICQSASY